MKKILIPSLLGAIIAIAGVFAFIQVDDATAVHTTILQTLERSTVVVLSAGTTAINDVPLLSTGVTGTEFVGRITAMIIDESQGAGLADVALECFLFANVANLGGGDDAGDAVLVADNVIDDVGDATDTDMADGDNCEIITADVAANTEAIITIDVDSIS